MFFLLFRPNYFNEHVTSGDTSPCTVEFSDATSYPEGSSTAWSVLLLCMLWLLTRLLKNPTVRQLPLLPSPPRQLLPLLVILLLLPSLRNLSSQQHDTPLSIFVCLTYTSLTSSLQCTCFFLLIMKFLTTLRHHIAFSPSLTHPHLLSQSCSPNIYSLKQKRRVNSAISNSQLNPLLRYASEKIEISAN